MLKNSVAPQNPGQFFGITIHYPCHVARKNTSSGQFNFHFLIVPKNLHNRSTCHFFKSTCCPRSKNPGAKAISLQHLHLGSLDWSSFVAEETPLKTSAIVDFMLAARFETPNRCLLTFFEASHSWHTNKIHTPARKTVGCVFVSVFVWGEGVVCFDVFVVTLWGNHSKCPSLVQFKVLTKSRFDIIWWPLVYFATLITHLNI